MRMKIGSMIVACSLAVLAFSSPTLACPAERIAGSGAKQAEVTQVVDARPACSRSGKNARALELASDTAACCVAGRARAVAVGGEKTIPARRTMKLLIEAIGTMKGWCGPDCAARANVVAAVRTMADARPDLACDAVAAVLASEIKPAPAVNVAARNACCAQKLAQVRAVAASDDKDKAACRAAAAARAVRAVARPSVYSVGPARYVAFGCEKTDRIARAAARAYIDLMRELKLSSGAQGCSAKAASQVLASVLDEMRAERTAETPDAPVADVKTTSVSLGVVGESADAPKSPACSKSRN